MKFNIGDVVRLKSGGPVMTVSKADIGDSMVDCIWFDTTGKKFTSSFDEATLEEVK